MIIKIYNYIIIWLYNYIIIYIFIYCIHDLKCQLCPGPFRSWVSRPTTLMHEGVTKVQRLLSRTCRCLQWAMRQRSCAVRWTRWDPVERIRPGGVPDVPRESNFTCRFRMSSAVAQFRRSRCLWKFGRWKISESQVISWNFMMQNNKTGGKERRTSGPAPFWPSSAPG